MRDIDSHVEGEQVALLHGLLRDASVYDIAASLLIVHRVMFDIANDVLALFAFHQVPDDCSGKQRIFSRILKGPAISWIAGDINPTPESHIEPLISQLPANQRAVFASQLRPPTG